MLNLLNLLNILFIKFFIYFIIMSTDLDNAYKKADNYLLQIYRESTDSPKQVIKQFTLNDILKYKKIVKSSDNIIYEESYDKKIRDLSSITDYFIYPCRMKCLVETSKDKMTPYDLYIKELEKNTVIPHQSKRDLLYRMRKTPNCSLLHFRRLIHILKEMVPKNSTDIKYIDCSAGWGDRMIAAMLLGISTYTGYDPNTCLQQGHQEIINYFKDDLFGYYSESNSIYKKYQVISRPFENDYPDESQMYNQYDICVSSPPFFTYEIYSTESTQSTSTYKTSDDWLYKFLIPSFKKIMKILKPNGYLCWYIEDKEDYKFMDKFFKNINQLNICNYIKKIGYKYDDDNSIRYFYVWQKQNQMKRSINPTLNKPLTYYIKTDIPEFTKEMMQNLDERGYIESNLFPVNFIFVIAEHAYYRNKFDTKKSNWINLLEGKSKNILTNKIELHKKYQNNKNNFLIHSDYISTHKELPKLPSSFIKILKPLLGFTGKGIKIVKSSYEIKDHLRINEKYSEWILQDYILNPDLINKHKFHFRILILVKVDHSISKKNVYIFNKFIFNIAEEIYKQDDFFNKKIHDTHYRPIKQQTFPTVLPDNWSKSDATSCTNKIYDIIRTLFKDENDFKPAWNAINGFEIFGIDIMFENKNPYLIEINEKMGYFDFLIFIIPDLINLILEEKESDNITKLL